MNALLTLPILELLFVLYGASGEVDVSRWISLESCVARDMCSHDMASWYGPGFYGKIKACGGTLKKGGGQSYAVANKDLPCGTMLLIINPENGKMVWAKVEDRGPYIEGREFDLNRAAAVELGTKKVGVAPIFALNYGVQGEE